MNENIVKEFEPIFYPRSIAVVGASRRRLNFGTRLIQSLLSAGFTGPVYAVNPGASEIAGAHSYPSIASLPGVIDYVVSVVPASQVPDLIDACADKGVKVVQMFTAGYRETGQAQAASAERELVARARSRGVRIVGPNCVGVFNPRNRMPYPPMSSAGLPGNVAFISQSGGHATRVVADGLLRGVSFSKAVSFGNGSDIDSPDYLEYLAADPETRIIGAYLEGVRDGQRLLDVAREASRAKPLVLWKGGRTPAGAAAAASHTGSLASSDAIWSAAARQMGAVRVSSAEEMVDTLLAFQCLWPFHGRRVAVISGLVDGGGGDSVAAGDGLGSVGLDVSPFSTRTLDQMRELLVPVGTISRNPLDVGGIAADDHVFDQLAELAAADPDMDLLLFQLHMDLLLDFASPARITQMAELFVGLKSQYRKPVAVVSYPGARETERFDFEKKLVSAHIPTFPSLDRAAQALSNLHRCLTASEG